MENPLLFPVGVPDFDKWMLVGTIAFCATCFFNSTVYHTFMSHSERAYGYLLRLDYCGINGVIVACTVGGVYFGYEFPIFDDIFPGKQDRLFDVGCGRTPFLEGTYVLEEAKLALYCP
jgi:hypothetical protein